jgi:hypothetical protein
MSCCTTLTSIEKGCENNLGGIKNLYIVPLCHLSASTLTISAGTITALSLVAGQTLAIYEFNKNTSSYVEEASISLENGSTFYTVTTSLMIPRREVAKRNSLALIAAGQPDLFIIMEDANGIYWAQGLENGANLTAQGEGSGVAKADGSKYSLTFLSEEPEQMYAIDAAVVAAMLP